MTATTPTPVPIQKRGVVQRMLDTIERVGNKVPHPAIIFLALCLLVIVLSAVLNALDVSVTYESVSPPPQQVEQTYQGGSVVPSLDQPPDPVATKDYAVQHETAKVESLLDGDGIRFLFTSAVSNFNDFGVVAVILVAMIGVGVAEEAGLIAALIRKLVRVAPEWSITFIIVLVGMISSIASDAGYLVLIPLGAVVFKSLGRNPIAGIAAAFAGVSAGFGVNFLITPVDGVVTEITNESIHLVEPGRSIDVTANLWFGIFSTLFLTVIMTLITTRIIERSLGRYDDSLMSEDARAEEARTAAVGAESGAAALESRGLRLAGVGVLVVLAVVVLLTALPGAPLRNQETGAIFGDSPLMQGLIFVIMLFFLAAGLGYGRGAGTLRSSNDIIGAIVKTFAGLASLIFLLLIVAQFIAYFNYSNIAKVIAVSLADWLERANIGAVWLLIGFVLVVFLINFIIPGVMPKWAILAPIFVPLFLRLGVAPQTVLAAYRIGDGPSNVVTPLMVYLPFIVLLVQRYRKDAGLGTVVSMMLPYTLILIVTWTLFFVAWYLLGIPLGPGAPVHA